MDREVTKPVPKRFTQSNIMIFLCFDKKTGDKSGEVTARMNLSDLRLVVGLKSNSNIHPNIFRNTNINNSPLPVSYQGYSNLPGKSPLLRQKEKTNPFWNMSKQNISVFVSGMNSPLRRRRSVENLKLSPSPDKNQPADSPAKPVRQCVTLLHQAESV